MFITLHFGCSKISSTRKIFFSKPIEDKRLEREVFGLKFKNPVGLAAGFDKNAVFIMN
jgi:dihydroorotate dehydrogenase